MVSAAGAAPQQRVEVGGAHHRQRLKVPRSRLVRAQRHAQLAHAGGHAALRRVVEVGNFLLEAKEHMEIIKKEMNLKKKNKANHFFNNQVELIDG